MDFYMVAVPFILVGSGVWVLVAKREHLLSALLSLEYISLGIYFMFSLGAGVSDLFYCLLYITFTACEGALGLAVLIIMSRSHGGDYFKTFNLV